VKKQEAQTPPESVLRELRTNFEKLDSNMEEDAVFRILGLARYREHLEANSRFVADGAGANWRYYIDDQNGYTLAFRSFLDAYTEVWLKLPREKHPGGFGERWRTKRVKVKPIKPTRSEQNRFSRAS